MPNQDIVSIPSFVGMDVSRSIVDGNEYQIGQLMVNQGRQFRGPLHPRLGLSPVTSDNGNHNLAGECYAMGYISQGTRLMLVFRLSGGRLVATENARLE